MTFKPRLSIICLLLFTAGCGPEGFTITATPTNSVAPQEPGLGAAAPDVSENEDDLDSSPAVDEPSVDNPSEVDEPVVIDAPPEVEEPPAEEPPVEEPPVEEPPVEEPPVEEPVANTAPSIDATSINAAMTLSYAEVSSFTLEASDAESALNYTAQSSDSDVVEVYVEADDRYTLIARGYGVSLITLTVTDDGGLQDNVSIAVSVDEEVELGSALPIVFESDFSQDTGYNESGVRLWNQNQAGAVAPPTGFDGVYAPSSASNVSVIQGAGWNGSNALRLSWAPGGDQATVRLGKHLTGDVNTGYDELYIRYRVKLPDNFRAGNTSNGSAISYWKWGRLWQNTWPTPDSPREHRWSENRENSGYVVWNFGGTPPYTDVNVTWSENTGTNLASGSSGGARQKMDFFVSGADRQTQDGYFESMGDGAWALDASRNFVQREQRFHTIEYRFKLASQDGADDGIFEMWWDGVKQGQHSRIAALGGASARTGIPTANRGSGFNFLVMFDNMVQWSADWASSGIDGHVLISDVVISTAPIGDGYVVGN